MTLIRKPTPRPNRHRRWTILAPLLALQGAALSPAGGRQEPVFPAEIRLVVLHPTVRNGRGELVTDLDRPAFTVYENGKPQPIAVFRRDDVPVSLGILIDNSGSMRPMRSTAEAAALAFALASNPEDEMFVLNFADKPRIDVPFTTEVIGARLGAGARRLSSHAR